jgi:hypothetical protein
MNVHLIKGFEDWRSNLTAIRQTNKIRGLEWLFVFSVHLLHIITISGWIKFALDPLTRPPDREELACRNKAIETWVVFEFLTLLLLVLLPAPIGCLRILVASYILFEILLNLCSIIFVGKLADVYPPTPSIERSLLLFGFNVLQVIFIFAIFYRATFGLKPQEAIFQAALVLGTIGSPTLDAAYDGWWVIAFQILTNLVLLVVFLAAYVGNLGAFKRTSKD